MDRCGISMTKCFWCGEADGIAIPKFVKDFDNAPCNGMVVSYEPCQACEEKWIQGVAVLEVSPVPLAEHQPPIADGAYPSGNIWVVKAESIVNGEMGQRILATKEQLEEIGLYADK